MAKPWKQGLPGCPCCCPEIVCATVKGCGHNLAGVTVTVKDSGGATVGSGVTDSHGNVCVDVPGTDTYSVSISAVSGFGAPGPKTAAVVTTCGTAHVTFDLTPNATRTICIAVYGCNTPLPRGGFGLDLAGYWIDEDGNRADPVGHIGGGGGINMYPPGHPPAVAFISGVYPVPFGNPLAGATVSGMLAGTTASDGTLCGTFTGPQSGTITVTFPYGYKTVTFPQTYDGCSDIYVSVILIPLATYICCSSVSPAYAVIPRTLNLSDGANTVPITYGANHLFSSLWTGCDGAFPSTRVAQCVPGSTVSDVQNSSANISLYFVFGCSRDAYNHFDGVGCNMFFGKELFSPFDNFSPDLKNCRAYDLPSSCAELSTGGGPIPVNCPLCLSFGTCPHVFGSAVTARFHCDVGSITWDPFDATFTYIPPLQYDGHCPDGTGGTTPPTTTIHVTG